jgi:predicted histidine transporter YuiF (NhaC family)
MAGIVDIIALSIPLAGMVVAIIAIYLEYKKKMTMIEKGLVPEEEKEKYNHSPTNKLAWGIAILGIGISLLISWRFNFGEEFFAGMLFVSIGIGLLTAHFWNRTK